MSNRKFRVYIVIGLLLFCIGLIFQFYHIFSRDNWIWVYPYMNYVMPLSIIGFALVIIGIVLSHVKYTSIDSE